MRKVTEQTCNAFLDRERKTSGNTTSTGDDLLLHGNCIAWHDGSTVNLRMCGWGSVTTRERLNGLLDLLRQRYPELPIMGFRQSKGEQYLCLRTNWGSEQLEEPFSPGYCNLEICVLPGAERVTLHYESATVPSHRDLFFVTPETQTN